MEKISLQQIELEDLYIHTQKKREREEEKKKRRREATYTLHTGKN